MGAKKLQSNTLSDRETVRWTVSTFLQRSEATAIKSLTFSAQGYGSFPVNLFLLLARCKGENGQSATASCGRNRERYCRKKCRASQGDLSTKRSDNISDRTVGAIATERKRVRLRNSPPDCFDTACKRTLSAR